MLDRIFEALVKLIIKPNGVIAPQGTNAHIYSGYGTPEGLITVSIRINFHFTEQG